MTIVCGSVGAEAQDAGEIHPILSLACDQQVRLYPDEIPGIPAAGQKPTGAWGIDPNGIPTIYLSGKASKRIVATLKGEQQTGGHLLVEQALGWLTLAHEYAHSVGYDHGEHSIGAQCAAFRHFFVPLCVRAGVDPEFARKMRKAVATTNPCTPWVGPVGPGW